MVPDGTNGGNCCNLRNCVGEYQSLGVHEGKYQSLGIHEGVMERVLDLIPFWACVDLKMDMLSMATCFDVELLIEHSSFNILDEGDILKWFDIAFTLNNQG